MTRSRWLTAASAAIAGLAASQVVEAAPFQFTFHDTVVFYPCCLTLPGVNAGDLVTVTVLADNGADTLIGQSWYQADVISATATVGGYSAIYRPPFFVNDPMFRTNESGQIDLVWFADTDSGNSDSLNGSAFLSSNAIGTQIESTQYAAFFAGGTSVQRANYWSVTSASAVPEPAPYLLILAGIGAASLASRRCARRPALSTGT